MKTAFILMIASTTVAVGAALMMMRYLGDRAHKGRGNDTPSGEGEKGACTTDALFERSAARLEREIHALSRRGNLNLTIGVITTGFAIGLLAYMVMNEDAPTGSVPDVLAHYIPRVTTVSFIEVFSYFFLRLYRASLAEIKFYQNELTALASQQIALDAAREVDHEAMRAALDQIARHNPNAGDVTPCRRSTMLPSATALCPPPSAVSPAPATPADDPRLKLALELIERVAAVAGAKAKAV